MTGAASASGGERLAWVQAAVEPEAFAHEQERLGRVWNVVGFTSDIPADGDWFRTELGGRSVFFQRFGDEIRGFENRCAHRFYPLRTTDRGNGPVLCGFHHWRYNQDGVALGIPACPEMFGKLPREINARLTRLDVAICGALIFARFASDAAETLEDFLGGAFALIAATGSPAARPHRFTQDVRAYWKFSHHISLDDYHLVAVHPSTFGKQGYLKPESVKYARFGRHSAFMHTYEVDYFGQMRRGAEDGTWVPRHYTIFNLFPNFVMSQYRLNDAFGQTLWYVSALRYQGLTPATTRVHAWIYRTPYPLAETILSRRLRPVLDRMIPPIVGYFGRKVMNEDNAVVEGQQLMAREMTGSPILGRHEERIGWFEEAYAAAMAGPANA